MNNRRRHERLEIDLPASLAVQERSFDDCRICNFSQGGVYLHCGDERLNELLTDGYIAESDRQEAVLRIASNHVRIDIVYKRQHGVGGSISDPEEAEALYAYLQAQRETKSIEKRSPDSAVVTRL